MPRAGRGARAGDGEGDSASPSACLQDAAPRVSRSAWPCHGSPSHPAGVGRDAKNWAFPQVHEATSLIPHLDGRGAYPEFPWQGKRGEQSALLSHHCHTSQLFSTGPMQLQRILHGKKVPRRLPTLFALFLGGGFEP